MRLEEFTSHIETECPKIQIGCPECGEEDVDVEKHPKECSGIGSECRFC
jgi:hypothetical protein